MTLVGEQEQWHRKLRSYLQQNNIIRKVTYNIHIFVVSGNRTRPNLYGFAYTKISSAVVVNVS